MDYYKGYWMVTNRCNLRCSYCVLEDSPTQLKAELNLENKKELISHMYGKLGFRRLTLSGGEVVIFGKKPPSEFIELLRYLREFKSEYPEKNLEIELYTNGTYINEIVAKEMQGVIDLVAVTIDGTSNSFLDKIGRNFGKYQHYYDNIISACNLISQEGIGLKLHSVVGQSNHNTLPEEVYDIFMSVRDLNISCWKFYQYMSYDAPEKDSFHAITTDLYNTFKRRVTDSLRGAQITLHFKDNEEMNSSLFNILSYGNAQYMESGDTWSTSKRTEDLRLYDSMADLFAKNNINVELFKKFHGISR
jgi:MoaA/NifB/PqqE/SkfB family radical SAM enzyme